MQAKLPARVKINKITYWLAYRRVQIEILVVGKEHLLHLINGQTSQKCSASFQPFKFNGVAENLRWHAPKTWQLEIHFRDAPNGSVAHSKRFGNLTGTFAHYTWLVLLRADHVADSNDSSRNMTVEIRPVSTVPGYVVYHQTRDVSGQSLFSWPTCMLGFSTSLSAPIRQQPVHLTWVGQGTPVIWFSQLP